MTPEKIALGRRLFYDADLSVDGSMSCATCHVQRHGFADGNASHPGVHGDPGRRNVPGLANVAWLRRLTWADPRLTTLEAQVAVPVAGTDPVEMGMAGRTAEIAERLGRDPCYRAVFRAAFPESGGRIDMNAVAKALAAFERTLVSDHSPYDHWRSGAGDALTPLQQSGARLFAKDCAGCHAGPDFTDGRYHAVLPVGEDEGVAHATGRPRDRGLFRTPGLRNVAVTAPYLHDGSARTLEDAIGRHAPIMDEERAAITAFLQALTDTDFLRDPRFPLPPAECPVVPQA
jgi:cytochrome c peroxidase